MARDRERHARTVSLSQASACNGAIWIEGAAFRFACSKIFFGQKRKRVMGGYGCALYSAFVKHGHLRNRTRIDDRRSQGWLANGERRNTFLKKGDVRLFHFTGRNGTNRLSCERAISASILTCHTFRCYAEA